MSRGLKPEVVVALMSGLKPGPISEAEAKAKAGAKTNDFAIHLQEICSDRDMRQHFMPASQ